MLDTGNGGVAPPEGVLKAIRHAVAAGACRIAFHATLDTRWEAEADWQSRLVVSHLHQAAADTSGACAAASTSKLISRPARRA